MKIRITESQYQRLKNKGIITEQSSPFYVQEKTKSGAVNPNGDYVYSPGVDSKIFQKPKGAIDAKQLFPSGPPQGGYPRIVPLQQIKNISSTLGDLIQGKPITPLPALPFDWQTEEQRYAAFNEPLGKSDRTAQGRYKRSLPPQTNKYFYDPNKQTTQQTLSQSGQSVNKTVKGGWVAKTLANVSSWRDVPAGYYPPDYPKALEFEKVKNTRSNSSSSESTSVAGKQTVNLKNPYFRPEFPLGNSQEAIRMYDDQIAAKQKQADELSKQIYGKDPVQGSDHFANVDLKNKEKIESVVRQGINVEIDKLNAAFGRYEAEQKSNGKEGYDWFGFLLTVSSILPVVGQAATVVNVVYNLGKAYQSYDKGDYTQAGLNLIFAVLPQVSSYLKGLNPLNVVSAGGAQAVNIEKYLAENASKIFTELTSKLGGGISQNLSNFANNPQVLLSLEKIIGKTTSEVSARGMVKTAAGKADELNKKLTIPSNKIPGIG
jgi:hypothetical protein